MRGWWTLGALAVLAACSSDDRTGPGVPPDVPASLSSTSLDGAIALSWTDNSYTSDPGNFENYRVYSTSYDLDQNQCGSSWQLEGTTVSPEFVVGALTNGTPRCFGVSAVSIDGFESGRSPLRSDTPRPDSRNIILYATEFQAAGSGFRFWDDLNNDGRAVNSDGTLESNELGIVRSSAGSNIDFFVDRDGAGDLYLTPVRAGTGAEYYDDNNPVEDLTSIDFAADRTYRTTPVLAIPGYGYVFEMDGGDGFKRYGAVRLSHVGHDFLILDWAYQTDPGNPELLVRSSGK
jgi:hypothetical protein